MKIINWISCTLKNQCAQIKLNRRTMLWWSDLNLNQILGRVSTKIKYEANLMDIAEENCAVNMSIEYFLQFLRLLFVYNHCFNNKSNKKLSKEGGAKRWANSSCKDVIIVRRPGPSTELPCSKEAARAMMRLFALCLLFTSWFCPAVCLSSQATTAKGLECVKESVYGTIFKWAFPLFFRQILFGKLCARAFNRLHGYGVCLAVSVKMEKSNSMNFLTTIPISRA